MLRQGCSGCGIADVIVGAGRDAVADEHRAQKNRALTASTDSFSSCSSNMQSASS
jgi:hypothetical protein